jgi:hypothetical protein
VISRASLFLSLLRSMVPRRLPVGVIKDDNIQLAPIGPDMDTYGLPGGGRYVEYLIGEARSSVPA